MEPQPKKINLFLWIIVFGSVFQIIHGQDSHYWGNQYGTRAQMLGGVVVGSLSGLSATYYNPGALALPTNYNLVLTTDAVEFINITHQNGAGKDIDLSLFRARVAPSLFAVRFKFPGLKGSQFAFSYLTRYDIKFDVSARRIDPSVDLTINERSFSGEITYLQDFVEPWIGLSWADTLVNRLGFGITQYIAIRSHQGRKQIIAQAIIGLDEGASANYISDFRFFNFRLLWKLGLSFNLRPLTFGFTLTTHSIDLYGEGSNSVNTFINNVDIDGDSMPDNELASNYQDKLPAQLKSPFSIAVGASYRLGTTTFHFSAEWFDAISQYAVMSPAPFQAQSSSDIITPQLNHSLRSITNFGFGIEYTINEKLAFFGGFTTDFSALNKAMDSDIATTTWDIQHLSGGVNFTVQSIDFALGFSYGSGGDKVNPLADFTKIDQPAQLFESTVLNDITFWSWRIILGFSVPL